MNLLNLTDTGRTHEYEVTRRDDGIILGRVRQVTVAAGEVAWRAYASDDTHVGVSRTRNRAAVALDGYGLANASEVRIADGSTILPGHRVSDGERDGTVVWFHDPDMSHLRVEVRFAEGSESFECTPDGPYYEVWTCDDLFPAHVCADHAVPYESDGALGHGFECGVCGEFLQAG